MAKPRVFISSTYYDLRHVRASLDAFFSSMGFDPILSEKGTIAYDPDMPLDESCYRDAASADILVLIVGGRYGSAASTSTDSAEEPDFFRRYESITRKEFEAAIANDRPCYILIDSAVYGEYHTFKQNRANTSVVYAHAQSLNVFLLIDDILARKRNNPVFPFSRFEEIEGWLRLQIAGLFKDLLDRKSKQKSLESLAGQVERLEAVNRTLQTYLERVVEKVDAKSAAALIEAENEKLRDVDIKSSLSKNDFVKYLMAYGKTDIDAARVIVEQPSDLRSYQQIVRASILDEQSAERICRIILVSERALSDLNDARRMLGKDKIRVSAKAVSEARAALPAPFEHFSGGDPPGGVSR